MTDENTVEEETPLAESEPAQDLETGSNNEVEATEEKPDGEETQETKPDAKDTNAEPGKSRAKKRIRQLTRTARTLEQENRQLRERLDSIEERIPKPEAPQRPDRESFETQSEYEDAVFDWRESRKAEETPAAEAPKFTEEQQAVVDEFESKLEAAGIDDDLIDSILFTDWSTPEIAEFCRFSEKGAQIAEHLYNDPNTVKRIAQMSPLMAVRELEKVEANLPLKNTSAPPPPLSESKPGGSAQTSINEDKLSDAEWNRLHKAGKLPSQQRQRTS